MTDPRVGPRAVGPLSGALAVDPLFRLASDLVAIPSVNPMGRPLSGPEFLETRLTDFLEDWFRARGIPYLRQPISPGRDNLYAPFYLWHDGDGMNAFLGGTGFATLVRDFGRPPVRTWVPWQAELAADLRGAACATRELLAIPAHADLAELRHVEAAAARQDRAAGALAAISAYDPTGWTLLRFRLWPELRAELPGANRQLYRVGHVSCPTTP